MCINSCRTDGEKVKTEEKSKKCKIVLRFEINKRINRNINAGIKIAEKILYTLNFILATVYWQHPLKFPVPARSCLMSTDIAIKQNEPSQIITTW